MQQTRIQRGETLSLALEMVSGDLTGATCAMFLKKAINGNPPADASATDRDYCFNFGVNGHGLTKPHDRQTSASQTYSRGIVMIDHGNRLKRRETFPGETGNFPSGSSGSNDDEGPCGAA